MMRNLPATNRLLDSLPARDRASVIAACDEVDLPFAAILDEPGGVIRDVYFPTGSSISLLASMGGKNLLEVALAGSEGIYGVPLAFGVEVSPVRAVVQGAGTALRMGAATFQQVLVRVPALRSCVDRYIYVVMSQLIQTAGCNRFHVVEQRVARWLLMTADRAHSPTFRITHEFLAYMLGVRRVGVTEAATALQKRELISYSRGLVSILDRDGLEMASCGCYRADVEAYDRAFEALAPAPAPLMLAGRVSAFPAARANRRVLNTSGGSHRS
ncbi:MAG: Crp/Fnr family transcriptional regulator [Usitatibacter sp.]